MPLVLRRLCVSRGVFALLLFAIPALVRLEAQQADSTRAGIRKRPSRDTTFNADSVSKIAPPVSRVRRTARDSTSPPLSPGKAFLVSLALPGLAQAKLDRGSAGNVYFLYEALSWTMLSKSAYDLHVAKRHRNDAIVTAYKTNTDGTPVRDTLGNPILADTLRNRYGGNRVRARRTHLEDWIATLIFNHLFSGADAYVSAHLWDLPVHVGFRVAPAIPIARAISRY